MRPFFLCKLRRENSGRYTNEHIGELPGFRSRSAFNTVFKKITALASRNTNIRPDCIKIQREHGRRCRLDDPLY